MGSTNLNHVFWKALRFPLNLPAFFPKLHWAHPFSPLEIGRKITQLRKAQFISHLFHRHCSLEKQYLRLQHHPVHHHTKYPLSKGDLHQPVQVTRTHAQLFGIKHGHSDVALRWQHPGDELSTFVPSIPAATNAQRDAFYKGASVLVSKGDHIRFQDINLAYDLGKSLSLRGISGLKVFLYIDNIGMLWKATKFDTDPDYGDILPSRSYSLGINLNL